MYAVQDWDVSPGRQTTQEPGIPHALTVTMTPTMTPLAIIITRSRACRCTLGIYHSGNGNGDGDVAMLGAMDGPGWRLLW